MQRTHRAQRTLWKGKPVSQDTPSLLRLAQGPPRASEARVIPAAPAALPCVLVIDDDLLFAHAVERVLRHAGYGVLRASSADAGAALLSTEEVSAVLCDIRMPGASGVELLREARAKEIDVPVVLMTGDPSVETAAEAVELGAFSYLLKPVAPDALLRTVERATKLHGVERMRREVTRALAQEAAGRRAPADSALDRALETMWVAFQPIVRGGCIFGYEALLRSAEPSLPHPGAVLGAAESLDRLSEVGRRVRRLAAEAMAGAPDEPLLFVNLHAADLADPELLDPAAPLSTMADRVVLEITERASLDGIRDVRGTIARLRALGFRIAVDDLGAGYAGLTSFAAIEPEFVKLDMSLVRSIHASPIRQKLVGSIATLCRDIGMLVVAEGIETLAERDALLELGCELMQGYLFARPGRPFPAASWPEHNPHLDSLRPGA